MHTAKPITLEVITANSLNCSYAVNCNGVKMQLTATEKKLQLCENAVNCNRDVTAVMRKCS
jgi:hypothetical protein